jgi:hypothetical protein
MKLGYFEISEKKGGVMENLPMNTENRLRELLGCWEMASDELKKK